VIFIGDEIARVYELNKIQAGEIVEFANSVKRMTLNLENENVNVRIVTFGSLPLHGLACPGAGALLGPESTLAGWPI
jgi:F0F1-type ATP synthase alpha subunit